MKTSKRVKELIDYLVEQIVASERNEHSNSQRETIDRINRRSSFYGGDPCWDKERYPID